MQRIISNEAQQMSQELVATPKLLSPKAAAAALAISAAQVVGVDRQRRRAVRAHRPIRARMTRRTWPRSSTPPRPSDQTRPWGGPWSAVRDLTSCARGPIPRHSSFSLGANRNARPKRAGASAVRGLTLSVYAAGVLPAIERATGSVAAGAETNQ